MKFLKILQQKALSDENERFLTFVTLLKKDFGLSSPDIVRKGVSLLFIAKQEEQKGRRLVFVDDNDNVVVEVHSI
jgi:hypothetical protein